MGIYLLAGKNGDSSFYIKLDEIQPIMNLSHPWFDVIDLVTIWACPAIGKRIDAQEDGLYYPPQAGMQQKMVVWKKIIDEAANCPKKQPAAR